MSDGDEQDRTSKVDNILRWVFLPFFCIVSWCVAVFVGNAILTIAEVIWIEAPTESGSRMSTWTEPVKSGIYCFSAGLSAFLVVMTAFFVAPTSRAAVSWIALGIGGAIGFLLAVVTSAWDKFAVATMTGFVTAYILMESTKRPAASDDRPIGPLAKAGQNKRWRAVVVCVLAIATIFFAIGFNLGNGFAFPPTFSIVSMEAKRLVSGDGHKEGTFFVPADLYGEILSALSPSWYDRSPKKWQVLGNLEIRTVEGESISVFLFDLPDKKVGAFAVGPDWKSRRYCRGGNSERLKIALERAMVQAGTRE